MLPVTVCPVCNDVVGASLMVGASLNRLRRTKASTAHTTGVKGSGVEGAGARNGLRMLVMMPFRKLTTPTAGLVTCAAGATAAATASVDCVSVEEGCATVSTVAAAASTTLTEAVGVVAASVTVECAELDSVLTGVD